MGNSENLHSSENTYSRVAEVVKEWEDLSVLNASAKPALQIGLFALFATHNNAPSPDELNSFHKQFINVNAIEGRDAAEAALVLPIFAEIFLPKEPSHQDVMNRYGIKSTYSEIDSRWIITLPRTFSFNTQYYLIEQLRELGALPSNVTDLTLDSFLIRLNFDVPTDNEVSNVVLRELITPVQDAILVTHTPPAEKFDNSFTPSSSNENVVPIIVPYYLLQTLSTRNRKVIEDAHMITTGMLHSTRDVNTEQASSSQQESIEEMRSSIDNVTYSKSIGDVYRIFVQNLEEIFSRLNIAEALSTNPMQLKDIIQQGHIVDEIILLVKQIRDEIKDFLYHSKNIDTKE